MASDQEKLISGSNPKRVYPAKHVLRLGVTQIVIGCLVIAAQVVIFAVYSLDAICQGMYCGFAFAVCGVVGVVAGKRCTTRWITAHLVLCIIACFMAFAVISLSAMTSVFNYGSSYTYHYDPCQTPIDYLPRDDIHDIPPYQGGTPPLYPMEDYWNSYYNGYGPHGGQRSPCYSYGHYVINVPWVVQFSMNLLMGALGIISAILSVVAATLSCVPLCCDPLKQQEKEDRAKLLDVTSQEQEAGPLPVKVAPSDVIVVSAAIGSSHI